MARRKALPPTLIIGSGPVAAAAAIVLARSRDVILSTGKPPGRAPSRIDSLPLHSLAALIELGVHPAEIGISERHDTGLSAWDGASPKAVTAFPKVHVDRRLLDAALLGRACRLPGVTIAERLPPEGFESVVDASGRRALTAAAVHRPATGWVARTRLLPGRYSPAQAALRIAATAQGYAYRLATPAMLVLGFVGPSPLFRHGDAAFEHGLKEAGAGWILAGLPAIEQMEAGRGGACSVQWTDAARALAVGDASFAPDALAAQGLAAGLADALRLADPAPPDPAARRERHVATLRGVLARCRWARASAWAEYDRSLAAWIRAPRRDGAEQAA